MKIYIFCDADWMNNASDWKSISGYVVTITGGAVLWSLKKQQTIVLSTAKAKYVSATHIVKQVLWHHSLFKELSFPIMVTSIIFTDNQAVISISHHPEFHAYMKHIDINLHFLHDLVSQGTLDTVYINTHNNLADLFPKGLLQQRNEDLTYHIGVLSNRECWSKYSPGADTQVYVLGSLLCGKTIIVRVKTSMLSVTMRTSYSV